MSTSDTFSLVHAKAFLSLSSSSQITNNWQVPIKYVLSYVKLMKFRPKFLLIFFLFYFFLILFCFILVSTLGTGVRV